MEARVVFESLREEFFLTEFRHRDYWFHVADRNSYVTSLH